MFGVCGSSIDGSVITPSIPSLRSLMSLPSGLPNNKNCCGGWGGWTDGWMVDDQNDGWTD